MTLKNVWERMTSHNTLPSAMIQAGILQEEMVNFRTGSLCRAVIALRVSRPEVLPIQRDHPAQCRLLKQETPCGVVEQFFISPLVCSHSSPQACLWMCAARRVSMLLWSWCAAYILPLLLARLCLAQQPADFSWSRSEISITETQCLVTAMVNQDHEFVWAKNMLVGSIISLERVHCPHPC